MKSGLDAHTSVPPPPPLGGFMHLSHCLNDFGFQEMGCFPHGHAAGSYGAQDGSQQSDSGLKMQVSHI